MSKMSHHQAEKNSQDTLQHRRWNYYKTNPILNVAEVLFPSLKVTKAANTIVRANFTTN